MRIPLNECPDPDTEIDLGNLSPFKYKLYQTNAPQNYDYGDTIHVHEYKGVRLILLPNDEFKINYQLGRYGSGLKTAVDVTGKKTFLKMALDRMHRKLKGLDN